MQSRWAHLDGPTHYLHAKPDVAAGRAPVVLAVHGLGGSSANWLAILPDLARDHEVYAIDLVGHGRTRADGRSSEVAPNQALVNRFIRTVIGEPVTLLGNSMGGLISLRQAARHPSTVRELVLIGPALPIGGRRLPDPPVAVGIAVTGIPGLGVRLLARRRTRMSPEEQVADAMNVCAVDPASIPGEVLDRMVEVARERASYQGAELAIQRATRSTVAGVLNRRGYDRAIDAVEAPVLILHGEQDRLVPVESSLRAVARRPEWMLVTRPDLGHVPQMEDPAWTIQMIRSWQATRADATT